MSDAEKYFRAYCENDTHFFGKLEFLGGTQDSLRTKIEVINQMFRMGGDHKFAWDFEILSLALQDAGFNQVIKAEWKEGCDEYSIDGEDWWRPFESFYVNAC